MPKPIVPFRLQTTFEVDPKQGRAAFKQIEGDVANLDKSFQKAGKSATAAFKGAEAGRRFGSDFGAAATSSITGSIQSLGQTLGGVIGTAIAPGLGTAIGSTLGSAVDAGLQKISGPIMQTIQSGVELNKLIERSHVHFTTFFGDEKQAAEHMAELKRLSTTSGLDMRMLIEGSEKLEEFTGNLKLTNVILKAAADQSAALGDGPEGFDRISYLLGQVAERGADVGRVFKGLYAEGVNANKILAQSFGYSEKKMAELIKAGRIRSDVAAQLIAESIERDKGGYARKIATTTTYGAEARFSALTAARAQEGTEKATQGLGDFYRKADEVLSSPQAQRFVQFIDEKTGTLINMIEKASRAGISVAGGIAEGIMSGDALKALGSSFTSLGDWTESTLKNVFEVHSPSERTSREIGVPLGEGIADGMTKGFISKFKGETTQQIVATLEQLLQDPRVAAFFEAIKRAEHGAPNRIVGGRTVSDLSRHPNIVGVRTAKGPSTAFGNYQITGSNWYGAHGKAGLQQRLNLPDASAHSQLLAAALIFADRDGGAGLRALLAGDLDSAMKVAAKDWTSTPGSTIGGGKQRSLQQWKGYYNEALQGATANGAPVTDTAPMPVKIVSGTGRSVLEGAGYSKSVLDFLYNAAPTSQRQAAASTGTAISPQVTAETIVTLGEADAAIVNIAADSRALITDSVVSATDLQRVINMNQPVIRTVTDLSGGIAGLGAVSKASEALISQSVEDIRKAGIISISITDQLVGMIHQVTGMIPSQQVGKKRGLFSKILGIAAPFLSFIPGIGPILSTIVGAASQAIGGNYGGAVSSIAGGFQSGGVFTHGSSSPSSGSPSPHGSRAAGGPVYRGRHYVVGEVGQESFVPDTDGFIFPHGSRVSAARSGGGSDQSELLDLLRQLNEHLPRLAGAAAKLESFPPGHVVAKGARGLIDAMDSNAELIRLVGQRMRLA